MSVIAAPNYSISCYDGEEANGVAGIVSTLLTQNVENFPARVDLARRLHRPVTIVSTDTASACTLSFGSNEGVVFNGVVGKPNVIVIATVDQILDVSQLKMKASGLLPVGFFTKRGFRVLGDIATRKLTVRGLLTHPITSLRVIALLSVVS